MAIFSDQELISALKAKDISALEQLYDCYGDVMYNLAMRIVQHRQEAEDLVQEIFLSLWQHCTYDSQRGSLRSFLLMLVHSRAIDRVRSRQAVAKSWQRWVSRVHRLEHSRLPLDQAVAGELSEQVQQALAELPENQRQALEMAYYGGLTQAEIAQRLQVPIGTVKSWFRLGFTKLRRSLKDLV